jgi:murein DD-endopeptidase MepM/ murein hydrolase activator NlpD
VDTRQRSAAVAEQERDESLANYRDLREQSERIAARIRRAAAGNTPSTGTGGSGSTVHDAGAYFLTPVAGAYKSSDYGWRFDPYYHVSQLHAGVDLAVGAGTPVHAGAAGRVIYAGWNGGYGNYTCLLHGSYQGRSLSSCYAHQSSIGVSPGQWVARGQYIGRVGSTGASTGPHLHFEVRLDGSPVQPLGWLPGCLC